MVKTSDLRIVSGKFRGYKLKSPANAATHPMGAREKLALFNMVNVENAKVLDAYAGSGALGFEALSRGAQKVILVEDNRQVARLIQENLQNLTINDPNLAQKVQILAQKVQIFSQDSRYQNYFDVIFVDPPYDHFVVADLAKLSSLLAPDGILALSSPQELGEIVLPSLRISSAHTYARARITIYRKI